MGVAASHTPEEIGGYRVVRRLATGGTSDVLLARAEGPHGFGRVVVLKMLLPSYRSDPAFERMFAREAEAYARLNHPAIVKLYDFFASDEQLVMVLEFVDGVPLNRLRAALRSRGAQLDDRAAFYITARIFSALASAHAAVDPISGTLAPVIHRDVNPSNVLLPWDGHVKLADFGIAKVTGLASDTKSGLIKGTFGYMAPEQVRGETVSTRADVYAATLLLWELLTRKKAIQHNALPEIEVLRAMAHPQIPSLGVLRPDLPEAVRDLVARGLEPEPSHRTLTAEEAAATLAECVTMDEGRARLVETLAALRTGRDDGLVFTRDLEAAADPPTSIPTEGQRVSGDVALTQATTNDDADTTIDGEAAPDETDATPKHLKAQDLNQTLRVEAPGEAPTAAPPRPDSSPRLPATRRIHTPASVPRPGAPGPLQKTLRYGGAHGSPDSETGKTPAFPGVAASAADTVRNVDPDSGDALEPGGPQTLSGGFDAPSAKPRPNTMPLGSRAPHVGQDASARAGAGDHAPGAGASKQKTDPLPAVVLAPEVASLPPDALEPEPADAGDRGSIAGAGPIELGGAAAAAPPPPPVPGAAPPGAGAFGPPPPPVVGYGAGGSRTAETAPRAFLPSGYSHLDATAAIRKKPSGSSIVLWVIIGGLVFIGVGGIVLAVASNAGWLTLVPEAATPTTKPAAEPPATAPTTKPTVTAEPTATAEPTTQPTAKPTAKPTVTAEPTATAEPTTQPTATAPDTPIPAGMGEIVAGPKTTNHRVFVDGKSQGDGPGVFRVRCGEREIQVGSHGEPETMRVPCGGRIELP